jgi:hypothetical protein
MSQTANERIFNSHGEEIGRRSFEFERETYYTTTKEESIKFNITSESSMIFIWCEDISPKPIRVYIKEYIGDLTDRETVPAEVFFGNAYRIDGSYLDNILNANIPIIIEEPEGPEKFFGNTDDFDSGRLVACQSSSAEGFLAYYINNCTSNKFYMRVPIINLKSLEDYPLEINITNNPYNMTVHIMIVKEV